jgi:very-short-patch-repair endonuclease
MPAKISHYYFERVKLKSVNSPEQDSVSLPLASQKPAKKLATLDPADLAVPEPGQEGREGRHDEHLVRPLRTHLDGRNNCGNQLRVENRKCVKLTRKRPVPDAIILCTSPDYRIAIAIEVDDPYYTDTETYEIKTNHELGYQSDIDKERELTNHDWFIIRFSEDQVKSEALACCKFIAEFIDSLTETTQFAQIVQFQGVESVRKVPRWNKKMAQQMIGNKVRK